MVSTTALRRGALQLPRRTAVLGHDEFAQRQPARDVGNYHGTEVRKIHTGHGMMALKEFEEGVPPGWRIRFESGHGSAAKDVTLVTRCSPTSRLGGAFSLLAP